jgi:hypothetical protein
VRYGVQRDQCISGRAVWRGILSRSSLCRALDIKGVLELVRARGGLDIKDFGRVDKASEVRFDISPTISMLKVWGAGIR